MSLKKEQSVRPQDLGIYFHFSQTTPALVRHVRGKIGVRLTIGSEISRPYPTGIKASKRAWDNRLVPNNPEGKALRLQLQVILLKLQHVCSLLSAKELSNPFDTIAKKAGLVVPTGTEGQTHA